MTDRPLPAITSTDLSTDLAFTLDLLGRVGQDISQSFEFADIFAAIERHVGELLDTATLYIGLLDPAMETIEIPLFVDGGQRGPSRRIRVDDPVRPAARCIRENQEILKHDTLEEAIANDIPGTKPTLTALFRPLSVVGRMIGVMSVQSGKAFAYGERERLIFRSLCSSAAIALANAESYRRLAAVETLEELGEIGQEITASLSPDDIFDMVGAHVGTLFDTHTFQIGLIASDAEWVELSLRASRGLPTSTRRFRVDSPALPAARAIREAKELLIEFASDAELAAASGSDPLAMATNLYRPLMVGDRVFGVIAIQSRRLRGFTERQILAFRTLCSYVSIAVANADAYRQEQAARLDATQALRELRAAQRSLVEAEKLASLGRLVRGIAHEVNTPVGTALTVASVLGERTRGFRRQMETGSLKRSDLTGYLSGAEEAARQLNGNLQRASDLIRRFREVAVQDLGDERQRFDLGGLVTTVLATLPPDLRACHHIEVEIPSDLVLDTYPRALGKILFNLLVNSAQHAHPLQAAARIGVVADRVGHNRLRISVQDDGVGIAAVHMPQIFEPFFTTRRETGAVGLGLHEAYNLAVQALQGRLVCRSAPGHGADLCLEIPLSLPVL